ncbi:FHF complex subunit HOOK-interacting protein 1A [Danio rerio]|uniref:FHF complex subunit HOOK-interacting protein 1A n=1 Tax=Danio rerio TaxID=7955 RepID=A0A8M1REE2_DANRE|nr:protein FAM160A1-like [Danio rerio]|eukprot:XP_002666617.3 protein FAM160A1-like [Danio rerio]
MLASVVSGNNGGRTLTLKGVDPETCMIVFRNHWTQVLRILEKHDPVRTAGIGLSRSGSGLRFGPIPGDEASAVQNYVEHMLFLLMEEECGQSGAMGTILEFVVVENVMEKLFLWSLRREFTDDMKLEQLRMYKMLVAQAKQPLLHHKPILKPLMMLLSACSSSSTVGPAASGKCSSMMRPSCTMGPIQASSSSSGMGPTVGPTQANSSSSTVGPTCTIGPTQATISSSAVETELVSLLNQLCRVLVKDASVLELFFHSSQDQGAANFLIFSLLIPFIHRDGMVGTQARDALTLIMSLSAQNSLVAKHIVENTYFCPVLATGLSGLYSGLPAKLEVYSDGWFCLEEQDWLQVPALLQFLNSLHFCSTVCKVAHVSIRDQLLGYIYNGFLVPVLAPALHKLTLEEVMTTTAYLELFLRSISDPALLQTFLIFILRHRHDNVNILDTLVSRINTPFQLGTVSLALFRTLIGLYCEDVMLQLILRYLVPCAHLSCSERQRLTHRDCYSISASALLSITPSFFIPKPSSSPAPAPKPDYILWSKVTESLLRGSLGMEDLFSVSDTVGFSRIAVSEPVMDRNYLQYLYDARRSVCTAVHACSVWSAPYDGLNPSPDQCEDENENENVPPRQTPTPHPPSESSSSIGTFLELEWDDFYEASSDAGDAEHPIPDEPPKHIQEMRKSAIMLIRGSYIEESDFQDDVLVYNLIAQKDARDDRRTLVKNGLNKHHVNAINHINTDSINENDALKTDKECEANVDSAQLNGDESEDVKEDFISQCVDLIQALGGDDDEFMEDEERIRRFRDLLEDEDQMEIRSFCEDGDEDEEEEELNKGDRRKPGNSFTGPFISVLLSRLENMLENSIEVNLLVTGILAQLAAFPQPLLRGFLLNTRAALQAGGRSLYQVLLSVGSQIELYAAAHPEFPDLARESAQYLLLKDQALKEQESDVQLQEIRSGWFMNTHTSGRPHTPLPPCPKFPPHLRSRVFATVLFAEFLKELAAIAQEHSILLED